MTAFLLFGLAAVGTYCLRIVMVIGDARFAGSGWLQRHVLLVSPAVLAAIVARALLVSDGSAVAPNPTVLIAVGLGAYVAHRSGNVLAAFAAGLPAYWIGALAGLVS